MLRRSGSISKAFSRNKYTSAIPGSDKESGTEAHMLPFSHSRIGQFFQEPPSLGNQFKEDVTLTSYLKRVMPDSMFREVSADLGRFGERVSNDVLKLHVECEQNPPYLKQYNSWGKRVDDIVTCEAWKKQKVVSAEEGVISIAYERKQKEFSRLYQIAKLYLYNPSSGLYGCPLAMTDGAARTLETLDKTSDLNNAYSRLISRDPRTFWTSGQWMTERKGGSDVGSGTETMAVEQADGTHKLYGYKWFSSATDSDMALTLARVVAPDGTVTQGSRGLSMFFLRVRDDDGVLNGIQVQRLKDKLGTRQLPTGELLLDGAKAQILTEHGRGVAGITPMLTLTRLHNSLSAAGGMRRAVNLARDYSLKRECFGNAVHKYPLHMKMEARSATLFVMELARLLGKDEVHVATDAERDVVRLMGPVCKLYTAKQAVAVASEALEAMGGQGYMEDTMLPQLLRDAQVLPIWEGTTNILSLDVLRALVKSHGSVLQAFSDDVNRRLAHVPPELQESSVMLKKALKQILNIAAEQNQSLEVAAREFAYSLARVFMASLLVEHASWIEATPQDVMVAKRWCTQDLVPVATALQQGRYSSADVTTEYSLVMDGRPDSKL